MIEKLISRIAKSQAFSPDDSLSRMVKEVHVDELDVEDLDLVYAARMGDADYAEIVKRAQQPDQQNK